MSFHVIMTHGAHHPSSTPTTFNNIRKENKKMAVSIEDIKKLRAMTGAGLADVKNWGGRLPKSNGGVQRFPQNGWKSFAECKGTRELDCETYKSSRCESRT